MLIIKPYGRSVVKEGKAGQRKRQIMHRQKDKKSEEARSIAEFTENHSEAVIAQWISVIDKIIAKPAKIEEPKVSDKKYKEKKEQYDLVQKAKRLRKILGDAAWKKLGDEKLLQKLAGTEEEKKKIEKIWNWKINATQPKAPKTIEGRWYKVFVDDIKPVEKNATEISDKIYKHLYEKAYRFPVKPDKDKNQTTPTPQSGSMGSSQPRCHKEGLIKHRANFIENNVLKPAKQKAALYDDSDKETYIKKAGDIADAIRKAVLDEWREPYASPEARNAPNNQQRKNGSSSRNPQQQNRNTTEGYKDRPYEIAVRTLRDTRIKVFDGVKAFCAARAKNPSLLNLHLQIKETYKYLLKGRKKLNDKLEKILPENNDALFRLMEERQKNRDVNHLIRLGKVIHYEASVKSGKQTTNDGRDDVAAIRRLSDEGVINSRFWSSEGQTEIKQNEAFVRIWRNVLAFAARTLKDWADPKDKIFGDILLNSKEALCQFNADDFDEKYKVLFGHNNKENNQKALLEFSLESIYNLRNAAFHFKGMGTFIKELEKKTDETVPSSLKNIYQSDHGKYQNKQKMIMEGGHFHKFFGREEIENIWQELTSAKPSILPLPKLKRVLERAEDAWKDKDKLQLPLYSTSDEREACDWARCQYTATKLLYDGPFKNWLDKQEHCVISNYIEQALEHTTQAAQEMNGKDKEYKELITAKAKNIHELRDKEKFEDFFFNLTAATATEMPVQNFYQSDGDAAKKQAEYIEKFKCDVIALAFEKYLKEKIKNIKAFCEKERTEKPRTSHPKQQENFDYESLTSTQIAEFELWQAWQEKLYFLLHLIPVEEVGSLRQQLKKWEIVTRKSHGKEGREKDILKVLGVFDLYIAMHDAQFVEAELKSLSAEDKKTAEALFENKDDFEKIFPKKQGGSEVEHLPIRGLREMKRFGRGILHNVYEKHKIKHEDVERWEKLEKTIAEEQKKLKKLHEEWVVSKNKTKWTKESEYKSALKKVEEYRHLKAQVMLQNHVRLHRLLMKVLGRLIDYSGLWERDLYFVLLALFYQKEQSRDKDNKIADDEHVRFLKKGQIVKAFIKLKDDKLKGEVTRLLGIKGVDVSCKNMDGENISCEEKNNLLKEKDKLLKEQDPLIWIRNRFAHFAMLEKENLPVNLTEEVNNARQLMAYDRKLKNAVSKSIIDLLEREKIELKWCMGPNHRLEEISSLASAKACHLGSKEIEEELCSQHFIDMVTFLFSGKKKETCQKEHRKNNE